MASHVPSHHHSHHRELLLLSLGDRANYTTTHIVNLCLSQASESPAARGDAAPLSPFANRITRGGGPTSGGLPLPRLLVIDASGATMGTNVTQGREALTASERAAAEAWHGTVDLHGADPGDRAPASEFARLAEEAGDENAVASAASRLDDPNHVRTWADFLKPRLPPGAVQLLPGIWRDTCHIGLANPVDALNTWTTTRGEGDGFVCENAADSVRTLLERCDNAQGSVVMFADDTPWVGPTAHLLQELRDMTGTKHHIVACATSDAGGKSPALSTSCTTGLCASLFLGQAASDGLVDAYVPLGVSDPNATAFEASAYQATALEALLTPIATKHDERPDAAYQAYGVRAGGTLDELFSPLTRAAGHFVLEAAVAAPATEELTFDDFRAFTSPILGGNGNASVGGGDMDAVAELYAMRGIGISRIDELLLQRQRTTSSRCFAGRFAHSEPIAAPIAFPSILCERTEAHRATLACAAKLRATRNTRIFEHARETLRAGRRELRAWGLDGEEENYIEALASLDNPDYDDDDDWEEL